MTAVDEARAALQRYDLTIEPNDSAYMELEPDGPYVLFDDLDALIAAVRAEYENDWTTLANDMRVVDGNHDLGAGALSCGAGGARMVQACRPRRYPGRGGVMTVDEARAALLPDEEARIRQQVWESRLANGEPDGVEPWWFIAERLLATIDASRQREAAIRAEGLDVERLLNETDPDGLRVTFGCHRHEGWHHHGGFIHENGPQHEAAVHVHVEELAQERLYEAMKAVEDHGKPLVATDYLAVAAEYARLEAER